jgi:hypothetical protein
MFFFRSKIKLKLGLDVGKAFFGLGQHLGLIFFYKVWLTTLPYLRVMSSTLYISYLLDVITHPTAYVVNLKYF